MLDNFNVTEEQHIGMLYVASGDKPGNYFGKTPREAADAYFAKYPKARKGINVYLAQEYHGERENMVRFADSWPQQRNVTKKDLSTLPNTPFEGNKEAIISLPRVMLFHLYK